MKSRTRTMIGSAALGVVMMFGSVGVAPVAAQDTPVATEEEDEGFDDWGLLGLLGLAGLAGLMKRPERETRTMERPVASRR